MPQVEFRRAGSTDIPSILELQSENYIANLSVSERAEGFLSAEFTPEQVAAMARDIGIIVAAEAGRVLGYLCAFRCDFDHGSPVLARMLEAFDRVEFQGKPLASHKTFIYGPVCVGRKHRRRGLLRGLYEALRREVAGRFDVGVAFVARDNLHSLAAHVAGLKMAEVGEFELRGNAYAILAFGAGRGRG